MVVIPVPRPEMILPAKSIHLLKAAASSTKPSAKKTEMTNIENLLPYRPIRVPPKRPGDKYYRSLKRGYVGQKWEHRSLILLEKI